MHSLRRPFLGSQLFVNRGDTPETLRSHVRGMADAGLAAIRLFSFWDLVQPRPDTWDWQQTDAIFDEADALGLAVVPTLFAQTPPGWAGRVANNQGVMDPEDPIARAAALEYLRRYVGRYRGRPSLHSWIVWNEPSMHAQINPASVRRFRRFLRERYGTIERYNQTHYSQYDDFDAIEPAIAQAASPVQSRIGEVDWHRFKVDYLHQWLADLVAHIRANDPDHPVHANPHNLGSSLFEDGQSLWRIAALLDFVGCSAHPVWHSTRFPRARYTQSIGLFCALARSATRAPERRFWVTELMGGPSLFNSNVADCPHPHDIRHWIWESIGRGAEATVFWTYNGRTGDNEAGEWMLLDQLGRPSRRLRECTRIERFLRTHRSVFERTCPPRATAAVLYSENSAMWHHVFGRGTDPADPRNCRRGTDAIVGAFCLLDDLGLEVDFVAEERLATPGALEGLDLLVLPDCVALDAQQYPALEKFVARGGHLIADGLTGWKTPDGFIDAAGAARLAALFGAAVAEIEPRQDSFALPWAAGPVPAWLATIVLEPSDAETLARWTDDERPAITRRRVPGGGTATRLGSFFFQRYAAFHETAVRDLVASLLPAAPHPPPAHVRVRRLPLRDGGELLIALNGANTASTFSLPAGAPWHELAEDEPSAGPSFAGEASLPPWATRIFTRQ